MRWFAGLEQFRGYRAEWLRPDAVAGVTVAAYLIPQVMAYATVAGLPPVVGLWTALGPMVVYVLLGSSRQLSVGPESTTALLTAVTLMPLAKGDAQRYATLAAVLALLVGVICLVAAVARLGILADLLSKPVLVGYLAGTAGIMIAGQLGRVSGVPVSGETIPAQLRSFAQHLGDAHWPTVILAGAVMGCLLVLGKWLPHVPGPLLAILAASLVVVVFSLQHYGIQVVGAIPSGVPVPGFDGVTVSDVGRLVLPAVGIAVVAFSDNALTARAFASRHGRHIDVDAELAALGATNVAAGFLHGFPVSCSGSRTTLADVAGARTQMYSVVAVVSVLAVLLAGRGVLAVFPAAALGALVVYAALQLIDVPEFRRIAGFRRSELVLAVGTTVAVLGLGVLYGVLVAIALSILDLLRRVARAHDAVQGFVPGLAGMHDIDDYPNARLVAGLVVYRYDAPLCFANAEDFRRRARAAVESAAAQQGPVRWFVLNVEANVEVDLTALDAMEQLRAELTGRGIVFALARVKQDLREALDDAGLTGRIGPDLLFPTLPTALDAYRRTTPGDTTG
ncbi:SulP family inorganic anion transporter [Nocardia wallacei]|uniref:SulP family inorganic anion transporter n=1 Tax=Nocardia wallacei TaxID=480035 RepID=UPI002453DC55|nr:SulP family inorganic anion transporter [Nocardia wallacei]